MKFLRVTTGVLALSLMAGAAMAQQDPVAEPAPGEPAAEAAPENKQASTIRKFLMLQVPVASMPDARLQQRLERARNYLGSEGLAPDQKQGLENEVAEIEAELARRAEAKAQPEAQPEPPPVVEAQPEAPPQPEVQPEPPPVVKAQPEAPPVVEEAAPAKKPVAMPEAEPETVVKAKPVVDSPEEDEARAMLTRQGDARKLSDDQLRRRLDTMRELLASRKLSKPTQRELRQALAQERKELRRRMRNEQANAPDATMPEPGFETGERQRVRAAADARAARPPGAGGSVGSRAAPPHHAAPGGRARRPLQHGRARGLARGDRARPAIPEPPHDRGPPPPRKRTARRRRLRRLRLRAQPRLRAGPRAAR